MKLIFKYNQEKDIWCLINKGKRSDNSLLPTKEYEKLTKEFGESPSINDTKNFIEKFISDNNININNFIEKYQKEWDTISLEYQEIAEKIFEISLLKDITVYLTINHRCPYFVEDNYFFVTLPSGLYFRDIIMHELWHFYTWYKFGITWENKIGKEKYNEIKESLTILVNVECKSLFPEGIIDKGYPQNKELRERILKLWEETKNIEKVWNELV